MAAVADCLVGVGRRGAAQRGHRVAGHVRARAPRAAGAVRGVELRLVPGAGGAGAADRSGSGVGVGSSSCFCCAVARRSSIGSSSSSGGRVAVAVGREGHARATELQARARSLVRDGWAASHPDALELLDHPVRERIAALLEPRPRYAAVDAEDLSIRFRDFRDSAELQETAVAVEMAETLGSLLVDRLGLDLARATAAPV